MGAAGKAREEELLAEISKLRKELADRAAKIDEMTETIAARDQTIVERNAIIEQLEGQIKQL